MNSDKCTKRNSFRNISPNVGIYHHASPNSFNFEAMQMPKTPEYKLIFTLRFNQIKSLIAMNGGYLKNGNKSITSDLFVHNQASWRHNHLICSLYAWVDNDLF